jgi:hypothetical protein
MSEPTLIAIIGFVGVILGASITEISHWLRAEREIIAQFRLAALEKRLAVHQEAFKIWNELRWSLDKGGKLGEVIFKGHEWWTENCLYLDPKSRQSFRSSLVRARNFLDPTELAASERTRLAAAIEKTGELIVKGVGLPTIGEYEGKWDKGGDF